MRQSFGESYFPDSLPIDGQLPRLISILQAEPNLVLLADTGAGKTTRVPPAVLQALPEAGAVWLVEPRRLAARAAARRIAQERSEHLGDAVGYHVRFDHRASKGTRLLVMTDGILLRRLQADPFLEGVGAIVFDEFHERSLDADLALALARSVQREVREDLRLVIMSATLDPEPVCQFLGGCRILRCPGRRYPVEILYESYGAQPSIAQQAAAGVRRILEEREGDILAFLPGVGEIHRTQKLLEDSAATRGIEILPLYGDLPPAEQDRALRPQALNPEDREGPPPRRVVLATNVAESSVTVEGLAAVVDTGYARTLRFDAAVGLDRLETVRISKASADQRAGRAGRQQAGACLRLWSEHEHRGLRASEVPEILRVDLSGALLQLLAWGEADPRGFPWFEAPPSEALEQALTLLRQLGAMDAGGLTETGRQMGQIPASPRLARLLLESHRQGCLEAGALLAAELSERSAFRSSDGKGGAPVDAWARVEILRQALHGGSWDPGLRRGALQRLGRLSNQLQQATLGILGPPPQPSWKPRRALAHALLAAYPDRLARRREEGSLRGVLGGGRGVLLLGELGGRDLPLFVCADLDAGRRQERSEGRVRLAAAVDPAWLDPQGLSSRRAITYDSQRDRVLAHRRTFFEDLLIGEAEEPATSEEAAETLEVAARENPERALPLVDPELRDFLARLRSLALWMPELQLPSLEAEALLDHLPAACAGQRSLAQVRRSPWLEILQGSLGYGNLRALAEHAPERLAVPSGSHVRLAYQDDGTPPILAVRIQEVFGLAATPTLARGQIPVLLHLLAPNGRPQQITRDLASFWANTYPEVRKELQGRYPKHAWPENPLTAMPERRPRRRR